MEQAGAIVYTVDMDTAAVTKGADRVNVALDSVGQGANKLDKAMNDAAGAMGKVGKATEAEAASLRKLLGQIDPTVAATGRLEDMQDQLNAAYSRGLISTSAYNANLAKLDAQFKKLEPSTTAVKNSSEGFGTSLKPLAALVAGVVTLNTLKAWGELAQQFTLLQARISRLSPDLATAATTYSSLLGIASQTGQTMPATVKLWESLTSSLKSLGATNSEVLTLTGTLQKIGKIGGSSAEETANALRQLGQSLAGGTLRAEEYNSIVEQTPELVRQLAAASGRSMGEFRQAMLDGKITSQELFDLLLQRVPAVDAEFRKLPRSVGDAANSIVVQFGAALSVIDKATKASQALAFVLDKIARGVQLAANPTDQDKFNQLINDRAVAEKQYQVQLDNGLTVMAANTKDRIKGINAEIQALQNARVEAQKKESGAQDKRAAAGPAVTTADGQKAIEQLAEQNAQIRAQGEERAKVIALQKLGTGATQQERDLAVALAVDTYRLQEAEKQRTKDKAAGVAAAKKAQSELQAQVLKDAAEEKRANEANDKAIKGLADRLAEAGLKGKDLAEYQARLSLNSYATPEQIARVKQLADALYEAQQAQANKQLLGQVDPIAGEQQKYELQLQNYQKLNDAKLLSDQRYGELKLQADTEHEAALTALQEERFRQQSKGNDLLIGTLNQLQAASAQAFVGLITGASSGQQAVQALAGAILNEAVGAVVAFGFAQLKSLIIGQTAGAAAAATSIGEAAAVATAWATPAALVSLASFGANSVPASAGVAATVGVAQGLAIGARQYGGPVDASKMYRVNETGAPEIFNAAGGKQYMMPNTRGDVVSNTDATSGGGAAPAPVVNVNNYSGQGATAKTRFSEADRKWVVDVLVGDMNAGGKSSKTVNQITGTNRKGT